MNNTPINQNGKDKTLYDRLVAREDSAWKEVYKTCYDAARRRLGSIKEDNNELAQDIAQETLMIIVSKLNQYDPQFSVKTWAYSIADKVALKRLQKNYRETRGIENYTQSREPEETTHSLDKLAESEALAEVKKGLDRLDPKTHEVVLYFFRGKNQRETARGINFSARSSAHARLKKGLGKLRIGMFKFE